ncbi:TIGR01777 family oxidoreductase [Acidicapsa ligni]|uniref:TIGR01777 family oxidoreductase n=1 Tax=Acidicapsa ligni TaxID=542300 RepID=UPI0021E0B610|nr:TIGR01777 family oxidoreductase [Acidicapsa ligni]
MPKSEETHGRILLSGASGMLGGAICKALIQQGHSLLKLVRRQPTSADELGWNPSKDKTIPDLTRLDGLKCLGELPAAIHLSGANVSSQHWTKAYKQEMIESRVNSTRLLAESLARLHQPPAVLITASATGFYGDRGDEILDESSSRGSGFFPELCAAWEAASRPALDAGIRVVHLRFGVAIGKGGIVARLAPLFRLGLGGPLGNGRQWMSWVSESDVVAAVLFALRNPGISGAFNTVSPQPVTNAEFTHELAQALRRPAILAAPAFALRLAFGQMADEALLSSTRAVPTRLLDAGFAFQHPTLKTALAAALQKE